MIWLFSYIVIVRKFRPGEHVKKNENTRIVYTYRNGLVLLV
jgi:hypothetical protein